jgi:hypothetical protein
MKRHISRTVARQLSAFQKDSIMAAARPGHRVHADGTTERVKRTLEKGSDNRRLIAETTPDGRDLGYHATKGWRAKVAS